MSTSAQDILSVDGPEWTVIYHKGFVGRAEFIRIMLADAGADWLEHSEDIYSPEGFFDCFRGEPAHSLAMVMPPAPHSPLMCPPAIVHRPAQTADPTTSVCSKLSPPRSPFVMHGTPAVMVYLASQLGYTPHSDVERALADQILGTATDYIAEGRRSFHPVRDMMSYSKQKAEGDAASREWCQLRMRMWLAHFEKILAAAGWPRDPEADTDTSPSYWPVARGNAVTYADFALYHVLDATAAQFDTAHYDKAWTRVCEDMPRLLHFHSTFRSRPRLAAYLTSPKRLSWAGDSMM
eukprot:TRINITY_DN44535_c0_g1_i1.p1 TRINITY_DN44535_c0_g1~~TRINITY_DN44535_c0_g1_i1.p1  ORF type:complete len:293 (-),score=25.34 TRINITY_DN44535_c0_g1_i1:199-1077(-)